jgi:hypothetical protein
MEESGKSSRGFRKKPSNCQRNNRNLQTSSKWEVCLTSTAFNESTKIIESIVIGFTIINDALLRTVYAYIKYKFKCTYWNVHE